MVIAEFKGNETTKYVGDVYQYDLGQVLCIKGLNLPKFVEIDFALQETGSTTESEVGITRNGVTEVEIPNHILINNDTDANYMIYAFVYLTDETSGETIRKIRISVKARSKPENFTAPEDTKLFHEAIKTVNESADRAETAEQQSAKHAEQTKLDAQQTTADRQEVEKLVDSVSGISEQVQAVKDYKEQAQTAATNALLSERASEQAKEAALQAQAGAETAEGMAEQHALETAGDKAEVDRMATQVRQDKTAVEQTKTAIDKTAQDFTLTAQQAVADVNNAGQTQTERVQSAGTTAVENIKTAQTEATGAVETKKTEAINAIQTEGATQVGNVTAEGTKQVQNVQNVAQEIIADREQIQTNKTDIADLRQGKADAIIETVSGTLINIKDSANAYFEDFSVFGKTEQVNTTGANLFDDKQLLDETNPNYDKSLQNTGIWWFKIPTEGVVTVSLKNGKQKADYYLIVSDKKGWNTGGTEHWLVHPTVQLENSATVTPVDGYIWLGVNISISAIKLMLDVVGGIMINKGTETKPYEQYTGCKPAPATDNLSPIVSAGENGNIKVVATGKNLIPFPYQKLGGVGVAGTINGVTYTVLKDGGIKLTGKAIKTVFINLLQNFEFANNKKYACSNSLRVDQKNGLAYYYVGEGQSINKTYYPQIEHGTVATKYEPYKEPQEVQLQLDSPLTKWDKIEKRDGIWGIARQGDRKILDGTEEWLIYGNKAHTFSCSSSTTIIDGFCTHYKNIGSDEIGTKTGVYLQYTSSIIITDLKIDNAEEFKAWLAQQKESGTPVELLYKTEKETWEPLPEETQLALNNLHTNYPTTIISNSEDCDMEVEYIADTKNYIDKKFVELSASIVATQKALL